MNRDLYHPLTISAIIIWIIMAFSFSVPYLFLTVFISLSFTIYWHSRNRLTLYLFVISMALVIGSTGSRRVSLDNSRLYIPIEGLSQFYGDLEVIKDSTPTATGFISTASLVMVKTEQFNTQAFDRVTLFSKDPIYKGAVIKNLKISQKKLGLSGYIKESNPTSYSSSYYRFRAEAIDGLIERTPSSLLIALITGNRCGLTRGQIGLFRGCGCSHILALSGFHVGIISALILVLLRVFFTGFKLYIITVLTLMIYLIFVGLTPSLLRAVLMFFIGVTLKALKIKISLFKILILSYLIMVTLFPGDFYTLSFKLSYLALAGILTMGDEIGRVPLIKRLPLLLKLSLSASLGAMIATAPLCFPIFGTLYPIGIVASLVLTPIITIFIWLGLLSLLIPSLSFLIVFLEDILYYLLNIFSNVAVIDNSLIISPFITLITSLIPVILVTIKLYRRVNAGRFNLKLKL